jgi:NADPH:quinone reductase-like Zn-dependent oxidoreductase
MGSDTQHVDAETAGAAQPATMRAVVRDRYGSAEVLRVDQVPTPRMAAGEVLVRVHAAGLDRGTWHLMTGKPYLMRLAYGIRRPRNPVAGREVAGTVVAVGADVTRFSPGDEVFGVAPGSFAEYAVAREDELAGKPTSLTFAQAAVVPISALTALQALTDTGRVRSGQKVLVVGASGGVGSYAVQIGKALGAEVTGVCSTAKLELVRSLGADHVIDYQSDDFADGLRRYDQIIDLAGNPSIYRLSRALTPTGTAVLAGGEDGGNLTGGMGRQLRGMVRSMFGRRRFTGLLCKERAADLDRLSVLIEQGAVTPSIDSTCPLDGVPDAMRRLEAGSVSGKIAITL